MAATGATVKLTVGNYVTKIYYQYYLITSWGTTYKNGSISSGTANLSNIDGSVKFRYYCDINSNTAQYTYSRTSTSPSSWTSWSTVSSGESSIITCRATRTLRSYTVSVGSGGNGSASGGGSYSYGSTCSIYASPNTGYAFDYWTWNNGSASGTIYSQSHSFTVDGAISFTAYFKKKTYTITVNAGEGGSASGGGSYSYGSSCTIKATATSGYTFSSWNGSITSNSYTFTVTSDGTYTAYFTKNTYKVNYYNDSGSHIGSQEFVTGGSVTISDQKKTTSDSDSAVTTFSYNGSGQASTTVTAEWSSKTEWVLQYWVDINGEKYSCGSSYSKLASINLYTSYGSYSGWGSPSTTTTYNTVTIPSAPTRSGYVFTGWLSSDGGLAFEAGSTWNLNSAGTRQTPGGIYLLKGGGTVLAQWDREYTWTFYKDSDARTAGTIYQTKKVRASAGYGTTLSKLNDISTTSIKHTISFDIDGGTSTTPGNKSVTYTTTKSMGLSGSDQIWTYITSGGSKGSATGDQSLSLMDDVDFIGQWYILSEGYNNFTFPEKPEKYISGVYWIFNSWRITTSLGSTDFKANTTYDPDNYNALQGSYTAIAIWTPVYAWIYQAGAYGSIPTSWANPQSRTENTSITLYGQMDDVSPTPAASDTHVITFNLNGGSGTTPSACSTTVKKTYSHTGWTCIAATGKSEVKEPGATIPSDTTNVNYTCIGVWKLSKSDWGNVTIPTSSGITKDRYEFLGWGSDPNGSVEYAAGQTYDPNYVEDLQTVDVLYAIWKPYLTVTFEIDAQDGSSAYIKGTEQNKVYVPSNSRISVDSLTSTGLKIIKSSVTYASVEAVPGSDSEQFIEWGIPTYTISSNTTITAKFRFKSSLCTLTFIPTVIGGSISASYAPGTIYDVTGAEIPNNTILVEKNITTTPFSAKFNLGYRFKKWSDGAGATVNNKTSSTCTINIGSLSTATVYVDFVPKYLTLKVGSYTPPDAIGGKWETCLSGIITGSFSNVDGTTQTETFVDSSPYKIQEGATGTFTWNKSKESFSEWYSLDSWYHQYSNAAKKDLDPKKISASNPWTIGGDFFNAEKYGDYLWVLYYSPKPPNMLTIITHVYPSDCGTVSCNTEAIKRGDTINFIVTPNDGYELRGVYVSGSSVSISSDLVFSYTIPEDYDSSKKYIVFTFKFAFRILDKLNPKNVEGYKWVSGDRDHYLESGEKGAGIGNWYYPGERFHRYIDVTRQALADKYEFLSTTYTVNKWTTSTKNKELEFYPTTSSDVTANFRSLEGDSYRLIIKCIDQKGNDASEYVDITPDTSSKYAVTYNEKGEAINPTVSVSCIVRSEYEDKYSFSIWEDTKSANPKRAITLTADTELTAVLDDVTLFIERTDSEDINKYNIYYWPRYASYHPPDGYNPYAGENNPLITPEIVGNCTWYAWGRTCEIAVVDLGQVHSGCLWTGNACNWFSSAFRTGGNSWEREGESDPTIDPGREISYWNVGDILCFTGKWGHVAIVEAINGDELTISESGYKVTRGYFWRQSKHTKFTLNEEWQGVRFQGVIHNPYAGKTKAVRVTTLAMPTEAGTASIGRSKDDINSKTMIISKGETVYFNAIVNEGHTFTGWYLNGEDTPISTSTSYSQTVGESATFIACFDGYNPKDYVQIDAYPSPEDSGNVIGGGTYKKGDLVTLTADEEVYDEDGNLIWYFSNWSDGTTTATYEFYASESLTLYANYAQDPEGRDQGSDMPLCDFYTTYGEGGTISVKSIIINATLYKYNAEFNSTSNQIRPKMTLCIGDQTIDISEDSAGTPYTITFEDSQIIETDKIKLVIDSGYSSDEYNSFNLNSISVTYLGWDPETGTTMYTRYYDGAKWTEWVEEVNNE